MKKLFLVFILGIMGVFISSCDSTDDPITPAETGSVFVTSTPSGAQIWLHGTNSGKVTPDTIKNLEVEPHDITLKLATYRDTTFSVNVIADSMITKNITLSESVNLTQFTAIIWETAATGANEPSGLDLSTGTATSVVGANKMSVDLYYSSTGFLVQSAHLNTTNGLTRVTKFQPGSSNNLNDGVNSALQNVGIWTNSMADRDSTKYIFLYDADGNYTKAKVTDWGGGTPGGPPAWVELTYRYNNVANDPRF